jgi:hypothetical protein
MFGNNTPTLSLEQLQTQYKNQLETLERMKAAEQGEDILGQVEKELSGMSDQEQQALLGSQDYRLSKGTYETGLLQFISQKFTKEYLGTQAGHEAAIGLLKTIRSEKDKISRQVREKEEKLNKVLELLDTDPELRKRYTELTMGEMRKRKPSRINKNGK